jgi:hypothetical protein
MSVETETGKSEATAPCKEMPVIPVYKVNDKKRGEEEWHLGSITPRKKHVSRE